ncbi:MAG: hypothetical protein KME03_19280 [Aphanocapsa lilacina HA4352-LM1]|jgi:hypothetical protein|nr:hypothetical protein [Aphanocapsa lilacina HA4352-LM1]
MPKLLTLTVTQSPAQLQKLMAEQTTNWAREPGLFHSPKTPFGHVNKLDLLNKQ